MDCVLPGASAFWREASWEGVQRLVGDFRVVIVGETTPSACWTGRSSTESAQTLSLDGLASSTVVEVFRRTPFRLLVFSVRVVTCSTGQGASLRSPSASPVGPWDPPFSSLSMRRAAEARDAPRMGEKEEEEDWRRRLRERREKRCGNPFFFPPRRSTRFHVRFCLFFCRTVRRVPRHSPFPIVSSPFLEEAEGGVWCAGLSLGSAIEGEEEEEEEEEVDEEEDEVHALISSVVPDDVRRLSCETRRFPRRLDGFFSAIASFTSTSVCVLLAHWTALTTGECRACCPSRLSGRLLFSLSTALSDPLRLLLVRTFVDRIDTEEDENDDDTVFPLLPPLLVVSLLPAWVVSLRLSCVSVEDTPTVGGEALEDTLDETEKECEKEEL